MKKKSITVVLLVLVLSVFFTACAGNGEGGQKADAIWDSAVYKDDTELGEGGKTVTVENKVGDNLVIFTVHTDRETVGEALSDNGLIDGEQGEFGLYVKTVNGIWADYDTDGSYWSFYIDGEYAMSGVDTTLIEEDHVYRLEHTKQ